MKLKPREVLGLMREPAYEVWRRMDPQPPDRFRTGDVAAITNGDRWAVGRASPTREAWPPDPMPGVSCPHGKVGDTFLWVDEKTVELAAVRLDQLEEDGDWYWGLLLKRGT